MKVYEMTKAQEKEMFARMIADCPAGYVRDILESIKLDVEWAINSDFGFVDISTRRAEMEVHNTAVQNCKNAIAELKEQISFYESRKSVLLSGLDSLGSTVRRLSQII